MTTDLKWDTREVIGLRSPKAISTNVNPTKGTGGHYGGHGPFARDSHSQCRAIWRGWQAYHMSPGNRNNYNDIAYNLGVCHHGYILEGRSTRSRPKIRGGANGNYQVNSDRLSICMIWGKSDGEPPVLLKRAFLAARAFLMDKAGMGTGVTPHRKMSSTECPGDPTTTWIEAGMPLSGGTGPVLVTKPVTPKPAPKPSTGLPRVNSTSPSARPLQKALKAAGFMNLGVKEADNYGPLTQAAVARFHNKYTRFRSTGKKYDPQIGPKGWAYLQKLASKPKAPKFNSAVRPGRAHKQVVALDKALQAAGYMPKNVKPSTYYGGPTQDAVAKFHDKNPQFKNKGVKRDTAIGPKGWVHLFKEAGVG